MTFHYTPEAAVKAFREEGGSGFVLKSYQRLRAMYTVGDFEELVHAGYDADWLKTLQATGHTNDPSLVPALSAVEPRWRVTVYEPQVQGGEVKQELEQTFDSEQDALDAGEAWVREFVEQVDEDGNRMNDVVAGRRYNVVFQ